jgi:hypothetical protein
MKFAQPAARCVSRLVAPGSLLVKSYAFNTECIASIEVIGVQALAEPLLPLCRRTVCEGLRHNRATPVLNIRAMSASSPPHGMILDSGPGIVRYWRREFQIYAREPVNFRNGS